MSVRAVRLIAAKQASDSAQSEYVCPPNTRTIIDKFTITNTTGGSVNISVWLVPQGESAADSNLIVKAHAVSAGTTFDSEELKNHVLQENEEIHVLASAATSLTVRASGREVT